MTVGGPGTSELCLTVAGDHPATLVVPRTGITYDYWMLEGCGRPKRCAARHLRPLRRPHHLAVRGVLNALALHGCSTVEAALPVDVRVVLVVAATPPSSSTC